MTKRIVTYTQLREFVTCRRRDYYRYELSLKPLEVEEQLQLGTLVHECLEIYYRTQGRILEVSEHIHLACRERYRDPRIKHMWHHATAMMFAYATRYPIYDEGFTCLEFEKTFEVPVRHPVTGVPHSSVVFAGKVDSVVIRDGDCWLMEHKTASTVDGDYIGRLWFDMQVVLYCLALEEVGCHCEGAIYNVIGKSKARQELGETDVEYSGRLAKLAAKNKSGVSRASRVMPESDRDFADRLKEEYSDPGMFTRVLLTVTEDQKQMAREILWDLVHQREDAKSRDAWTMNPHACYTWGRPCPYIDLCKSNCSPAVVEAFFESVSVHEELT